MTKAGRSLKHAARHTRWTPAPRPDSRSPAQPPAQSSSVRGKTRRSQPRARRGPDEWTLSWLQRWDKRAQKWTRVDEARLPSDAPLLAAQRPSHTHARLSFLTYNTFSSSPTHTRAQSLALASLITTSDCALVALQEVALPFYRFLLSQPSFREAGYAVSTPDEYWRVSGRGSAERGKDGMRESCVVLVKEGLLARGSEIRIARLGRGRDEGGKAAVGVRVVSGGREVVSIARPTLRLSLQAHLSSRGRVACWEPLLINVRAQLRLATSHFSSLPFNASLRTRQFRTCLDFLSRPLPPTTCDSNFSSTSPPESRPTRILLGDFNASNAGEFDTVTSHPALTLVDAFDVCTSGSRSRSKKGKKAEKEDTADDTFRSPPTFGHLYPWIRPPSSLKTRNPKPRKVRRIDRVYVEPGHGVSVRRYEHLGGTPLEGGERDECGRDGGVFASDHEGVLVEVDVAAR